MKAELAPVLMVELHASTFVKRDEDLIRTFAPVKVFRFRRRKGPGILWDLLRLKVFLLRNIWQSSLIYVWFADFHAVLPALFARLTGRKCVVVIGGVDAAYLPEYKYGTKTRLPGRLSLWLTVRLAHRLFAVSHFTLNQLQRNVSACAAAKAVVVHNCYTPEAIVVPQPQNRSLVLCVAMAHSRNTIYIKGVDVFMKAASLLPELSFKVVGLSGEALAEAKRMAAPNVNLTGPVSFDELKQIYLRTRVICQFSRQESFGIALLEALAFGCVPVIANRCGPAEVFAGSGVPAIDQYEPGQAASAIRAALQMTGAQLSDIQQRVLPRFDCAKRQRRLREEIELLLSK
ncbi:MAG: glycosyltransferase family 4 protein [Bacteroidetes bacterium]|nr:glycosyltransferase family 4 protein [Bacteroidota bacterium]